MLHCISVVAEKPPETTPTQADKMVDDLLSQYNPELKDEQTKIHERGGQTITGEDITVHLYGRYRFKKDEDYDTIVQELSKALDNHNDVSWYTVYYHDCDHDEGPESDHSCSLMEETSTGTTPDEVKLV